MAGYQGYRSYNVWNQVLELSNDEGHYKYLRGLIRQHGVTKAAKIAYETYQGSQTYDGITYTKEGILEACRACKDD